MKAKCHLNLVGLLFCWSLAAAGRAEAFLDTWSVVPPNPHPGSLVTLRLAGDAWPMCGIVSHEVTWTDDHHAVILLHPWPGGCAGIVLPWQREVDLGALGAGSFVVEVKTYRFAGSTIDNPLLIGTATFGVGGPLEVPMLSSPAAGALTLLLFFVGLWRLRR